MQWYVDHTGVQPLQEEVRIFVVKDSMSSSVKHIAYAYNSKGHLMFMSVPHSTPEQCRTEAILWAEATGYIIVEDQ
jgi:hypothetical protein